MFERVTNWFSRHEKSKSLTPLAPMPAVAGPAPVVKKTVEETGVEAFLAADGVGPREDILKKHPFWQRAEPMQELEADVYLQVLQHILNVHEQYAMALRYGHPAFSFDYDDDIGAERDKIRAMRGISWGEPKEYIKWQEHAMVLAQKEPAYADALLEAIGLQVRLNAGGDDVRWLAQAEHLLRYNGTLDANAALTGLCSSSITMEKALNDYPLLSLFLDDPTYHKDAIAWATQNENNLQWLVKSHQQLSSWAIAEHLNDTKNVTVLADMTHDGAILKAWHGVALTSEEIASHPQAYALYVHKYAPIYMEEAQPLNDTWSMALSLCSTGVDFKEMLLMAARSKMTPQAQPEHVALPDLGHMP